MYKVIVYDNREFSDRIDTDDIVLQINIQRDYHEFTAEEIFATEIKTHYAQFFPFETYFYAYRSIWLKNEDFNTSVLVAELIEE